MSMPLLGTVRAALMTVSVRHRLGSAPVESRRFTPMSSAGCPVYPLGGLPSCLAVAGPPGAPERNPCPAPIRQPPNCHPPTSYAPASRATSRRISPGPKRGSVDVVVLRAGEHEIIGDQRFG